MPVLEILTPDGKLIEASGHLLFAYALYPSKLAPQQEYAYVLMLRALLDELEESREQGLDVLTLPGLAEMVEEVPASGDELLKILVMARSPDLVIKEANKQLKRADVAGQLALLWLMAHNDPDVGPVGVTKAADALLELLDDPPSQETFGSVGRTKLFNIWSEFKSVAHIHVAIRLISMADQDILDQVLGGEAVLPEADQLSVPPEDISSDRSVCQQNELPDSGEAKQVKAGEEAVFFFLGPGLPKFMNLVESVRLKFLEADSEFGKELYTFPETIQFEPSDLEIPPLPEDMRYLFL